MKVLISESQIGRLKKNLLLERECPKGLFFDETLDSCVKKYDLDEVNVMIFKDDKDGKIRKSYEKYLDLYLKLNSLYKLNDMKLGTEYKFDSDKQKPSVKLFNNLSKKIKEKYKEEYENFDSIRRERFVKDEVRPMVGKPYVWGKAGPEFFDCSGLICAVFEKPRTTADGYFNTADIFTDINQLKVGDIVFFDYDPNNKEDKKPIDHVGIISSIKGSKIKMIHASGDSKCTLDKYKKDKLPKKCKVKEVNYSSFWRRNTKGFGRFVGFEY